MNLKVNGSENLRFPSTDPLDLDASHQRSPGRDDLDVGSAGLVPVGDLLLKLLIEEEMFSLMRGNG